MVTLSVLNVCVFMVVYSSENFPGSISEVSFARKISMIIVLMTEFITYVINLRDIVFPCQSFFKQLSLYHELSNVSHTLFLIFIDEYKRIMNNRDLMFTRDIAQNEKKRMRRRRGRRREEEEEDSTPRLMSYNVVISVLLVVCFPIVACRDRRDSMLAFEQFSLASLEFLPTMVLVIDSLLLR